MDIGIILGILGIILTIFFGILGIRAIKKKVSHKSQSQIVREKGIAIQSGRDTNIGKTE